MKKRKGLLILLLIAVLALSGCGGQKEDTVPTAEPDAGQESSVSALDKAQGKLGESVRTLMEPYAEILAQAAEKSDSLAYTIPGDILNQMALDAEAAGAEAQEGVWRFAWRLFL